MRDYLLVLRIRFGTPFRWRGRKAALALLAPLIMVLFIAVITRGAIGIFRTLPPILADYPELLRAVERNLLTMWALFTVAVVLSNALNSTFADLYQSEDTGFLLSLPLSPQSVFAARLTGSMLGYLFVAFPVTYGPYLAYGLTQGAGISYYVVMTVTYLAFLALVVGLATLLVTAVMAFVPGTRLKQWTMIAGLVLGLLMVLGTQLIVVGGGHERLVEMFQRIGGLRLGGWPVLPHVWLVRAAQEGLTGGGHQPMYAMLLTSIALYAGLVWLSSRVYVLGWASGQEATRRGRGKGARRARDLYTSGATGRSQCATPFWAVARKDLATVMRTPVQWYLLLVGGISMAFPLVNLARQASQQAVTEGMRLVAVGLVLLGASFGGFVHAGSAFSREGNNFPLLRTWPISTGKLFVAKVVGAIPVSLAAGLLGLGVLSRVAALGMANPVGYAAILACALVPTLTLMACLDTIWTNFGYANAMEAGGGGKGSPAAVAKTLVSLYGGMAIVALLIASLYLPTTGNISWTRGLSPLAARWLGYVAFTLEAALLTAIGLRAGTRRLAALTQESARSA